MAIVLVSYDLKHPDRNYGPVFEYLRQFSWCRTLESLWLLDTRMPTETIRDTLRALVDANDVVVVARLARDWAAYKVDCGAWLSASERNW